MCRAGWPRVAFRNFEIIRATPEIRSRLIYNLTFGERDEILANGLINVK